MALRIRRGTTAELATITPLEGEMLYDTTTKSLYIGDGATAGGKLLASGGTILEDIVLNGNDITGTGDINIVGDVEVDGSIHATGNITADGNITLGAGGDDTVSFDAAITTDLIPEVDSDVDLGSSLKKWDSVYAVTVNATTLNGDTNGYHTGDVKGSVFADDTSVGGDSTPLVDAVAGKIVGVVETTTVTASAGLFGNLTGNVTGNVDGDVTGNLQGNVDGIFVGEFRSSTGVVVGNTGIDDTAQFRADVVGNHYGSVFADTTGAGAGNLLLIDGTEGTINLDSTINTNIVPVSDGSYNIGSSDFSFKDVHMDGRLYVNDTYTIRVDQEVATGVGPVISFKGGSGNQLPVETTIVGNIGGVSRDNFQVANAVGIRPGAIFSIPGVSERIVATVNSGTGAITTTEDFVASGSTDGQTIIFYNPPQYTATYRFAAPTSSVGEPGDLAGMMFADSSWIYVCKDNYDGVSSIWVRSSAATW